MLRPRGAGGSLPHLPATRGRWLLAAAPSALESYRQWVNAGATWLRPGVCFAAVLVRASLVHAGLGKTTPQACAPHLAELLQGGPVFVQRGLVPGEETYVALIPATAGRLWNVRGTTAHAPRALLWVPAPDIVRPDPDGHEGPWWVCPPAGPTELCDPRGLAALALVGIDSLDREHDRQATEAGAGSDA